VSNARAFSTEFASHEGLIHSFARKGYGRLQAARVSIDYEDVFQEMCVSFTKAKAKYDPQTGFSFSAYFGRAIWNDFNKFADRLITERVELGIINFEDMKSGDDTDGDITEVLMVEMESYELPESRLEGFQDFVSNFSKVMNSLSPVTRKVLLQFIAPSDQMKEHHVAKKGQYDWGRQMGVLEKKVPDLITIEFVIRESLTDENERRVVRAEIKRLLASLDK
jgi:RNA polymerase sigma factor (sigma-70 family)